MIDNPEHIFSFKNVCKNYKLQGQFFSGDKRMVPALYNVSGEIAHNSIFGIVGESGSGKSTLMRLLVGAEKPSSGTIIYNKNIEINNATPSKLAKYQSEVKMVFQDPARSLNHRLTIIEILLGSLWYSPTFKKDCVTLGLFTKKSQKQEAYERITHTLKVVGLDETILYRYPTEFSGGQRQRIAIVRALIHNPEVLICDEITSSLDASTRKSLIDLLLLFREKYKITILFISHDLALVLYFCDKVMVMNQGRVKEISNATTLFKNSKNRETQHLIAALPKFPARLP